MQNGDKTANFACKEVNKAAISLAVYGGLVRFGDRQGVGVGSEYGRA